MAERPVAMQMHPASMASGGGAPLSSAAAEKPKSPVLCIFFDLESTGLYLRFSEIIELAAVARILNADGSWRCFDRNFRTLVRPSRRLPKRIELLTGLSNALVAHQGTDFRAAMCNWTSWLQYVASVAASHEVEQVWLVGHNVLGYDLPLLVAQDARERRREELRTKGLWRAPMIFEGLGGLSGFVDTLRLSRKLAALGHFSPPSHKLAALHSFVLGRSLRGAHTAYGDALGLADLCATSPFQEAFVAAVSGERPILVGARIALRTARERGSSQLARTRKRGSSNARADRNSRPSFKKRFVQAWGKRNDRSALGKGRHPCGAMRELQIKQQVRSDAIFRHSPAGRKLVVGAGPSMATSRTLRAWQAVRKRGRRAKPTSEGCRGASSGSRNFNSCLLASSTELAGWRGAPPEAPCKTGSKIPAPICFSSMPAVRLGVRRRWAKGVLRSLGLMASSCKLGVATGCVTLAGA